MRSAVPYALVVDDEAIVRADVAETLKEEGFQALQACNVSEALAILHASGEHIRMLVTDIDLSGNRNGVDLAQACATKWPHITILVVSGVLEDNEAGLPATAFAVSKPLGSHRSRQVFDTAVREASLA